MNEQMNLSEQFEANRPWLQRVATRLLGSEADAEDAVQEAWLRLHRSGGDGIENLRAWLTTVVGRVCLDMLRSRTSRREDALDSEEREEPAAARDGDDPERDLALSETVGVALFVMLDRLSPAERVAFVLYDLFDIPFDEIAAALGRSPEAARQLASRARRRLRSHRTVDDAQVSAHRTIVEAFLRALRAGDVEGLLAVLDPDVVVQVDPSRQIRGARNWAEGAVAYTAAAAHVRLALVDGDVGLILAPEGRLSRALRFTFASGLITEVNIMATSEQLQIVDIRDVPS